MKKVAIVGVEGSGKTVMLAGLGDLYTRPDRNGYFLAPKNFATANYVTDKIQRMRRGDWPSATAGDEMQGLNWMLKRRVAGQRPADICEVSFLDFAGEVYRTAFGIRQGAADAELATEAAFLKKYIREADELIVLINLHDVITEGQDNPRVKEAMWITNEILGFALEANGPKPARAAIAISQADSYRSTIENCGGPAGVLRRYLPHVANSYDWLDLFTVSAVSKIVLDDDGKAIPARNFKTTGLRPIMDWIRKGEGATRDANSEASRPSAKSKPEPRRSQSYEVPAKGKSSDDGCGCALVAVIVIVVVIFLIKGC